MRPWLLFALGVAGLGLALVVWAVGARMAGDAGWVCPMCGAHWRSAPGEGGAAPGPGATAPGFGHAPFHVKQRESYASPGERIYHTRVGGDGERIPFRGGPHWLHMHGGSCASCHGPGGAGGQPIPPTGVKAPDIRYHVLLGGGHRGHEHEHTAIDEDIKRAITRGIAGDGKPLDPAMPRFEMSERDLEAVVDYLKQLDGEGGD